MDSPLKWVGSKRLLKRVICRLIPPDHEIYVEPFAGSAAIYFFKNSTRLGNEPRISSTEVLNDVDGLLMNFYRVIQDDGTFREFMARLDATLVSREFFMEYRASDWDRLEPVERAFRLYYIVKTSYGGLFRFNKMGRCNSPIASSPDKKARSFLFKKSPLVKAHGRLKGTFLHQGEYTRMIDKYDSVSTFFYLDPPYDTAYAYNKPFDHGVLLDTCRNIKGRFLLSLNGEFEPDFSEFKVMKIDVNYSVTCKSGNNVKKEILVSNYG
ncbi:MAG: DNA adenine methylase [Promethearchaeota archaeon]